MALHVQEVRFPQPNSGQKYCLGLGAPFVHIQSRGIYMGLCGGWPIKLFHPQNREEKKRKKNPENVRRVRFQV